MPMPASYHSNNILEEKSTSLSSELASSLRIRMSPRSVLSFFKWVGIACVLISCARPALQATITAPGVLGSKTICDARAFRQAIVNICTFHRRDIRPVNVNPSRYLYNVNENESGKENGPTTPGERKDYADKLVFTQLGKETLFFPVEIFSVKVKRHREFALHRKCCLNGCNPVDFASVC